MPNSNIGFSFQPGANDAGMRGQGGPTSRGPALQPSNVEFRNLHIPRADVKGAIAPQALLQSPGAAGAGVGLADLLPMLIQAFAPQGQQPGVPSLSAPAGRPSPSAPDLNLPGPSASSESPRSPFSSADLPRSPVGDWINHERNLPTSPFAGGSLTGSQPNVGALSPFIGGPRVIPADEGRVPISPPGVINNIPPPDQLPSPPVPREVLPSPDAPTVSNAPTSAIRSLFEDENSIDSVLRNLYGRKGALFG